MAVAPEITARSLLTVLFRRRRLFVWSCLLPLAAVLLLNILGPPVYQSESWLQFHGESVDPFVAPSLRAILPDNPAAERHLLKAPAVLETAARRLTADDQDTTTQLDVEEMTRRLRDDIQIRHIANTNMVWIGVNASSAQRAQTASTALLGAFVNKLTELERSQARVLRDSVEAALHISEQRVRAKTEALVTFKQQEPASDPKQEITHLISEVVDRESEIARLDRTLEGFQSRRVALGSDTADAGVAREIDTIVRELEDQKASLVDDLARLRDRLTRTARRELPLEALRGELELARDTQARLRVRLAEMSAAAVKTRSDKVIVASPPSLPTRPIRPRVFFNLILSAVWVPLLAVAICLITHLLDQRVYTPHDIETQLNIPVLACVPSRPATTRTQATGHDDNGWYLAPVADAPRCLVVTSPSANQSVQTVAYRHATQCAKGGDKTLLINFDDPSALSSAHHDRTETDSKTSPKVDQFWQHIKATDQTNLFRMTIPHDSANSQSPPMNQVLGECQPRFDRVVVAMGPLLQQESSSFLTDEGVAVVLVIQAGGERLEVLRKAQQLLERAGLPLAGAVLTDRQFEIPNSLYHRI